MKPKFNTSDPDIIASWEAIRLAAQDARRLAERTRTPLVVRRDGRMAIVPATGGGGSPSGKHGPSRS